MYTDKLGNTFVTHSAIRKAYPEIKFPNVITDSVLANYNITPVPRELTSPELKLAAKSALKQAASEAITALEWRIERATEREKLDIIGEETLADVLREREAIRAASNRLDLVLDSMEDNFDTITLVVEDQDYTPVKRLLSQYKFRSRFTMAEKIGIADASKTNSTLAMVMEDMGTALDVDLDNADLLAGLQYIAQLGLLSEDRIAEIVE